MGIAYDMMEFIDAGFNSLGVPHSDVKMCELGAQEMRLSALPEDHLAKNCRFAKDYFLALGLEHQSFDINEKYGSIYVDLSIPIEEKWSLYFDFLTNFGTSEHIKNDQYQVFKNIHDLVKIDGVMLHSVPMTGRVMRYHSVKSCVYYENDFFDNLAAKNGYQIIIKKVVKRGKKSGGLLSLTMKKASNQEFMEKDDFAEIGGIDYNHNPKLWRLNGTQQNTNQN